MKYPLRLLLTLVCIGACFSARSQDLVSMNPNFAEPGETLTTTITGNNVFFIGATMDVTLEHDGSFFMIASDPMNPGVVIDQNTAMVDIAIPSNAPAGNYHLTVYTFDFMSGMNQQYTLLDAFTVVIPDAYLSGNVFYDQNANGVQDAGEPILPNQHISVSPGGALLVTDENGNFSFGGAYNTTYTLTVVPQPGWSISTTPLSYTVTLTEDVNGLNFGLAGPPPNIIMASAIIGAAPTCNQDRDFTLKAINAGSVATENGYLHYVKPSNAIYVTANPAPDSMQGDTLIWNFDVLQPFASTQATVTLTMPTGGGVYLNHYLTAYGVNATFGNADTAATSLTQIVTCSFDPNDKAANADTINSVDTPIDYVVRFQNTGNDTAYTVIVRDTLSAYFDISTFQLLDAHHAVNVQLQPATNSIEFIFDNILLVDSFTNEPASHGQFAYRVSLLSNVPPGADIHNTASIYFDLNEPVVTNDAVVIYCNKDTLEPQSVQICTGDSVQINGTWYSQGGDYGYHTSSALVCDVFAMTYLTVLPLPDATVTVQNGTFSVPTGAVSYQWFDCNTETDITGATNASFTPFGPGSYAVRVTDASGCVSTSDCQLVLGVNGIAQPSLSLSPNPAVNAVTLTASGIAANALVEVRDVAGRLVMQTRMASAVETLQLDALSAGVYDVRLIANNKTMLNRKLTVVKP